MNHPNDDQLLLHAYGELPESQGAELDAHLAACSTCRAQFTRFDAAHAALDVAIPPRRRLAVRWIAAGLAAAAVLTAVLLTNSPPSRAANQGWRPTLGWSATAGYITGGRAMVEIDVNSLDWNRSGTMACRISALLAVSGLLTAASAARAQEMPNPQAMQMQVQQIMQQRPREAEAAARAFLMLVAPDRVSGLDSLKAQSTSGNNQPIVVVDGVPITNSSILDQYWMEVAQLTVQFEMVQNLNRRDSVRAQLVARMFGLEANARAQKRAYRATTSETNRSAIRKQIEALISQHFDLEDKLRALEIADIERRLAEVRAETQRRIEKRAEFVRWAVDDIIRDATRPQ